MKDCHLLSSFNLQIEGFTNSIEVIEFENFNGYGSRSTIDMFDVRFAFKFKFKFKEKSYNLSSA